MFSLRRAPVAWECHRRASETWRALNTAICTQRGTCSNCTSRLSGGHLPRRPVSFSRPKIAAAFLGAGNRRKTSGRLSTSGIGDGGGGAVPRWSKKAYCRPPNPKSGSEELRLASLARTARQATYFAVGNFARPCNYQPPFIMFPDASRGVGREPAKCGNGTMPAVKGSISVTTFEEKL